MSELDLGLKLDYRFGASLFMIAAMVSAIVNGFAPSYVTEVLMWICINFFVLDKPTRRAR
tara:strand:- start:6919 stop:7098 length:180 start_codon:yes stop_codon:yes gene_type:complete